MPHSINDSSYLNCYGLTDAPFRLSPDPEFFFPSQPHIAAKGVLKYAIQNGEGFMVLIGPAGTGKTLLLKLLLEEIGQEKHSAVLTNPVLTPAGLLHQILLELGFKLDAAIGEANLLAAFQKILLKLAAKKKDLLIVIDEAQNMPLATLEYLRMLSNIETRSKKLLQILLTGQPELEKLLAAPQLAQLNQRVAVHENLRPFSASEAREYVNFRLAKAGRGDIRLTWFAKRSLNAQTGGVPRLINRLMDRTLLVACRDDQNTIYRKHIILAAKTLPGRPRKCGLGFLPSLRYGLLVSAILLTLFIR